MQSERPTSPTPSPRPPRTARTVTAVIAASALWLAGPANWPLWKALWSLPELGGLAGAVFTVAFGLMIAALVGALLGLLAWRATLKPAVALLLIAAAFGAHFMGTYGVVIDPTMIINVLSTDLHETRDLLSPGMLTSVALLAGPPIWWVLRTPVSYGPLPARLWRNAVIVVTGTTAAALLVLVVFADMSSTMRNHKQLRYLINPLNSLYSLGHAAYASQQVPRGAPTPIGIAAQPISPQPGQRAPLALLVIGETARADHFSLNGYARSTNPELRALNVLSFRNVTSCGTNTATSLPCMLSPQGHAQHVARQRDSEDLLDLLQRAGLAVLWIENQVGCKGVCDRVPHTRPELPAPGATAPDPSLCPDGECLDVAMLHGLDERLAALPAAQRARGVVLVMHQMGSHGPAYFARSPADRKPFQPECRSAALPDCSHESLVNAYDNSIAYTDHILALSVAWLQRQKEHYDPSLLYVSDHGESLGEKGLYLHGMPFAVAPREQTHVPMEMWLPSQTVAADRLDLGCLRGRLDDALSHDHLFHTLLGMARVSATEYRRELDVLAPCRRG